MKVLVTGGTGYIGSHTTVELQKKGIEVVIIDNLCNSRVEVIDAIEKISGIRPGFESFDICDKNQLSDFFKKHDDIKAVIHFAALKAVGESVENPLLYYNNNLPGIINLLECMVKNGINKMVFSSSCTVYGEPEELPVTEVMPLQRPNSPYGNTKKMCEEILEDVIHASSIEGIALRYFNPAGAHESALIGEYPVGVPNNLVPFITQTAIGKRESLSVFGNDYDTPDGTCIRDYIHVVDLAQAHVVAIRRLLDEKNQTPFEVFNLGTGTGYSVLEVVKSFERMSGVKLKYRIADRRDGDITEIYADTHYANKELNWKTNKSLDEIMLSAWNWEKALAGK